MYFAICLITNFCRESIELELQMMMKKLPVSEWTGGLPV